MTHTRVGVLTEFQFQFWDELANGASIFVCPTDEELQLLLSSIQPLGCDSWPVARLIVQPLGCDSWPVARLIVQPLGCDSWPVAWLIVQPLGCDSWPVAWLTHSFICTFRSQTIIRYLTFIIMYHKSPLLGFCIV